jgi:hypothetical protein
MRPVRQNKELQVKDTLAHPMAASENSKLRDRWHYYFLRVTREPIPGRPDSGRILVENVLTGKRSEFYAALFGVGFK